LKRPPEAADHRAFVALRPTRDLPRGSRANCSHASSVPNPRSPAEARRPGTGPIKPVPLSPRPGAERDCRLLSLATVRANGSISNRAEPLCVSNRKEDQDELAQPLACSRSGRVARLRGRCRGVAVWRRIGDPAGSMPTHSHVGVYRHELPHFDGLERQRQAQSLVQNWSYGQTEVGASALAGSTEHAVAGTLAALARGGRPDQEASRHRAEGIRPRNTAAVCEELRRPQEHGPVARSGCRFHSGAVRGSLEVHRSATGRSTAAGATLAWPIDRMDCRCEDHGCTGQNHTNCGTGGQLGWCDKICACCGC